MSKHTQLLRFFALFLFAACLFYQEVAASVQVRIFSLDNVELHENNLTRLRFYIQNYGTEPLSNFTCYYYFTTESNKTPVCDDYYTPDASFSLENLSNGNYRVKFSFTGITINPGQSLPNPDGEAVGIHYSDWSAMDKSNDFSNTGLKTFTLNGNMPVYKSDGTLIYGNTPSDPGTPPQPPKVETSTALYAVLSKENTHISDRVKIKGGCVGSGMYVDIGCDAVVNGDVYSGRSMFLRERDTIRGNAAAGEVVNKQNPNTVVVTGTVRSHAQLDIPQAATITVTPGTKDTTVQNFGTIDLAPGAYRDFHAFSNSIIVLHSGNYSFNTFVVEPDVHIVCKIDNIERLNLNVQTELRFADRTIMDFYFGTIYPHSIKMYSAQTGMVFIGNDCQIYGDLVAPNAEVHLYSRTDYYGSIYGRKAIVEPEVIVCNPPLLIDLWHSEWNFAPLFNPLTFDYNSVVSNETDTLRINPVAQTGTIVTVNDSSPDNPVSLSSIINNIIIKLTNVDMCGTTTYKLNVTKNTNYQIYVNDDSPCAPSAEDGNTWATAFKDLQKAIDKATVDGKEIWVAEGVYKPTKRTANTDPRSATFNISPGIEIKGGFSGDETDTITKGSYYKTILSGDISGNDTAISTWPPIGNDLLKITDNVYHVVTIDAPSKKSQISITGCVIERGVANIGNDINGAGVFVKNGNPVLKCIAVQNNVASSSGAGVFVKSNIKAIKNCLVKNNCSLAGSGAGLYLDESENVAIDASVFDGNTTNDTSSMHGGSAIRIGRSHIDIVNSILTHNTTSSLNGAIYSIADTINVINCTFAENYTNKNIVNSNVGISNVNGAAAMISNTILWNNSNKCELLGTGFSVSYSCVKNGYPGIGNINSDPMFENISKPDGDDGKYGDKEDGLYLSQNSPCINKGTNIGSPKTDIITTVRPSQNITDIGAYEYLNKILCNTFIFGTFRNGIFTRNDNLTIINSIIHQNQFYYYSKSNFSRVIRAYIQNDKYTSNRNVIYGYLQSVNADDQSVVGEEVRVDLKYIGDEDGLRVYQSLTPDYSWGKRVIFIGEKYWEGWKCPWAYIIYVPPNPELNCRVPCSQF